MSTNTLRPLYEHQARTMDMNPNRTVGETMFDPVSESFEDLSRKLTLQALDYLYDPSGMAPLPNAAIVQRDAHSKSEENEREYAVYSLGSMLDIDLDDALNRSELSTRGEQSVVALQPWMKIALGIANPDQPLNAPGTYRLASLNIRNQRSLVFHEFELPTITTDHETGEQQQRVARLMWMSEN